MKKNFLKKLSFVMASAMLISAIAPAAGAFGATSPALNSTKKYLHLSGISGKSEYDFNVNNKQTGWKYAWTTANENVAEVDNVGLATATGVGSTKVSVKITKSGKTVKTLSATVVVRDNIETVKVSNAPTKDLKVNETHDFNRTFVTEAGSTTKTSSITRWAVDKATATIDNSGVFKATEAGEYKVTAMAFQSAEKFEAWKVSKDANLVLATDEVKVTVDPTLTVSQTDLNTIKLAFDSAMTDVAKNLSVYTLVGTTEVLVTTAKPVTVSDDKKTATLDFYVDLTEGATYVVKYTGLDPITFVAAKAEVDKVAKVVVKTTEAVVNVGTAIDVQLFDTNNVEITKAELKNRVTFASSSDRVYMYDESGVKKLVFFTKGDTTQITATYHTYKYENGKEVGNIEGTGTIVGVDAASTVVGGVKAWTMVTSGPKFDDTKKVLTVGENKNLYVQLNTTTGSNTGTIDNTSSNAKFEFTSSDSSILFVGGNVLYPVKAGTVAVVVKYDGKAIDVLTITVGAERKATNIVLGKTDVTLSNSAAVADKAKVSVKVKDQYGDDFTVSGLSFEKMPGSPASTIATVVSSDVEFAGASAVKGAYYYKITANNLSAYVTVNVLEPSSTTASSYQLQLGATEVDNKSTTTDATPTISVDLFGYAGTKTTKPAITGAGFTVVVKDPDNNETTLTTNEYDLYTITGNAITAKKAGTYTVTAKNASGVAVDVKYFTVKNTQAKPSVETKSSVYTATTDFDAVARECFKVTFDGQEKTNFVMGDKLGDIATQLFVKTLKWTESITDSTGTYTIVHTIDVNTYVKVK